MKRMRRAAEGRGLLARRGFRDSWPLLTEVRPSLRFSRKLRVSRSSDQRRRKRDAFSFSFELDSSFPDDVYPSKTATIRNFFDALSWTCVAAILSGGALRRSRRASHGVRSKGPSPQCWLYCALGEWFSFPTRRPDRMLLSGKPSRLQRAGEKKGRARRVERH